SSGLLRREQRESRHGLLDDTPGAHRVCQIVRGVDITGHLRIVRPLVGHRAADLRPVSLRVVTEQDVDGPGHPSLGGVMPAGGQALEVDVGVSPADPQQAEALLARPPNTLRTLDAYPQWSFFLYRPRPDAIAPHFLDTGNVAPH